jgi:hypothetical protein
MSASAQMKWSALVDELTANATKFERKEQTAPEYSANYKRLIKELADEIRTNPYGGTHSRKVLVYKSASSGGSNSSPPTAKP